MRINGNSHVFFTSSSIKADYIAGQLAGKASVHFPFLCSLNYMKKKDIYWNQTDIVHQNSIKF